MTAILGKQNQAYNTLKSAYDSFSAKVSQQAQAHEKLVQEYEKEKQELENIRKTSGETSQAFQNQQAKVNDLASAVAKSSQNMSDNQTALSKMKTQLNQTETTVNNTTKDISELGKITEKSGEQAKKGGEGYTVFKNILANLGTKAITSAISGLKALGGTLINVGKQALESYADYEQLVGGVETLFGDSADVVQKYASQSYKTAGLSANQYMETVTSFSASLLQSLGGDTKKTAEYSNRAIIDMSDNANKMGTSMEMIQNAYQGFAKQNYTMLDNLKLGYGGTKTEMERLIKDASQMKDVQKELGITVDANSMSFGNIVNAISVVQKKMGIMGTTSKEASQTISGSVNAMKSAWSNLLTGIADDNADFNELANNFVESLITALNNILPRVEIIFNSLTTLIPDLLNVLLEKVIPMGVKLVENLITGISQNLPKIMESINNVSKLIRSTLVSLLPQVLEIGIQVIVSLIKGIAEQLPTLIPQMVEAVLTICDTLLDNADLIFDAGIELIMGLADGLIEALPILIDKAPILIDKWITAFTNNFPKILESGIKLVIKLAEGLVKAIPKLVAKAPEIINALIKGIENLFSNLKEIGGKALDKVKEGISSGIDKIKEVGKNLISGLWNGINEKIDWLKSKINGLKDKVMGAIKGVFGIHSPSTVMRDQVGKNLALGIGEGFEDEMKNVTNEMQNAIPDSFDTDLNVGTNTNIANNSYFNMVEAFKEALSEMKIELDDEVAGKFVRNTVTNAIYN